MDRSNSKMSSKFSSSTSSLGPADLLSEEERSVWNFSKTMLMGRLFIGNFQEKRYVEKLLSYRDVIVVNKSETDLIKDLTLVRNRLLKYYKTNAWIGITTPETIGAPVGTCLWVELSEEVFGEYWYKIKTVRFRRNEILLRLKVIRPVTQQETNKTNAPAMVTTSKPSENSTPEDVMKDIKLSLESAKVNVVEYLTVFLSLLTLRNAIDAIKFVSFLVVALVTGLFQISTHLGEFLLRFFRETNHFIHVSTPIALAVVNLSGKVIGGFYLLIAMMWRDWRSPGVHPNRKGPPPQMMPIDYTQRRIQNPPPPWQAQQRY